MAKQVFTITDVFQKVATGAVVITVRKRGNGSILFNETAADATSYKVRAETNEQFQQTGAVDTFVRATDPTGWEILVDGVL